MIVSESWMDDSFFRSPFRCHNCMKTPDNARIFGEQIVMVRGKINMTRLGEKCNIERSKNNCF